MEELEFTVEDLVEGGEYEFRVKAVNAAGVSKPSATVGPVIVKDQTCEYQHLSTEHPPCERLSRYLVVVQNKKRCVCTSRSCDRLSVDMDILLSHAFPRLSQKYHTSLHIAFSSLK